MEKNNSAQIYPDKKDSHGSSDVRIYKNGSWVAAPFRVRKFTQANLSSEAPAHHSLSVGGSLRLPSILKKR
jgi:hypothetical protein